MLQHERGFLPHLSTLSTPDTGRTRVCFHADKRRLRRGDARFFKKKRGFHLRVWSRSALGVTSSRVPAPRTPPCSTTSTQTRVCLWLVIDGERPVISSAFVLVEPSALARLHFLYMKNRNQFFQSLFLAAFAPPPLCDTPGSPSAWQHSQCDTSITQEEDESSRAQTSLSIHRPAIIH